MRWRGRRSVMKKEGKGGRAPFFKELLKHGFFLCGFWTQPNGHNLTKWRFISVITVIACDTSNLLCVYNHCAVSYVFFTLSEHTASTTGGCVFILSNVSAWATHRKKLRELAEWASYPHCTCSLWSEGYMQFMNQLATVYMQFTFYGKCKIHVCICTNKGKAGPLTSCPSLLLRNWEDGK